MRVVYLVFGDSGGGSLVGYVDDEEGKPDQSEGLRDEEEGGEETGSGVCSEGSAGEGREEGEEGCWEGEGWEVIFGEEEEGGDVGGEVGDVGELKWGFVSLAVMVYGPGGGRNVRSW
jgi:hypothetical protein